MQPKKGGAPVIFAKLGVCFWSDKKFVRAGLDASGYWAAVLAWLRDDETADAIIPFDMVGAPQLVGDKKGREMCERLVKVELFARRENGYELLRYADSGNELKPEIEARKKADRERKAKGTPKDSKRIPVGIQKDSKRASGWNAVGFPGSVSVSLSSGSPSPSLASEVVQETEGGDESETAAPLALTATPGKPQRKARAPRVAAVRTFCPSDDSPDLDAWLTSHGIPTTLESEESLRFIRYHRREGKSSADWPASWRTWINNAVKFMQQDQERKAGSR